MKYTYNVTVKPPMRYGVVARGESGVEVRIAQALANAAIRRVVSLADGSVRVSVDLDRPTHHDALNELVQAVQQVGYVWVEASVSQWTSDAVATGILGALGGGIAGGRVDALMAVLAAAIGGIVGTMVGSAIEREKVIFQVSWTPSRGWIFTAVRPASIQPGFGQPGLA